MHLGPAQMTFRYAGSFRRAHELEGCERLLLDAMLGGQSLFTRSDGIERLWEISAAGLLRDLSGRSGTKTGAGPLC
jgi:glucose-6-phosphate 1-dehydrogenase